MTSLALPPADCLHKYQPTKNFEEFSVMMTCVHCGDTRKPTEAEFFGIVFEGVLPRSLFGGVQHEVEVSK